jgi:hypothetical protein
MVAPKIKMYEDSVVLPLPLKTNNEINDSRIPVTEAIAIALDSFINPNIAYTEKSITVTNPNKFETTTLRFDSSGSVSATLN